MTNRPVQRLSPDSVSGKLPHPPLKPPTGRFALIGAWASLEMTVLVGSASVRVDEEKAARRAGTEARRRAVSGSSRVLAMVIRKSPR